MRFLAIGIASLAILAPSAVFAESGEELRMRGEQLAKDGRYTEAIDAFKAAERVEPRARHACLIALAYTRRELWPQAEIYLEACERRATPADPVPEWVPTAKQQLAERLATVNVAPVTIKVEPPGVDVKLAVSSFAPDELFDPRTIHLPPGRHVVIATAKGYNDAQKTIDVTDKAPQDVVITMLPVGTPGDTTGPGAPLPVGPMTTAPASKVPMIVMIAGGALVGGGVIVWGTAWRGARNDMLAANSSGEGQAPGSVAALEAEAAFNAAEKRFDRYRALSLGLYAAGAITVGVGVVLKLTKYKTTEASPSVSILPTGDGGGMVTVGWMR